MTISPTSLKSVICLDDSVISPAQLGYICARAQSDAHEVLLSTFTKAASVDSRITKAFLAKRVGKKPEQMSRWLGVPGNITVATFAEILAAFGYAPTFGAVRLADISKSNDKGHTLSAMKYAVPPVVRIATKTPKKDSTQNSTPGLQSKFSSMSFNSSKRSFIEQAGIGAF